MVTAKTITMKKAILLSIICLSAGITFAQTQPVSYAIYKVDTIQYPANKYRVASTATAYQMLKKMGDFKFDKDTSLTYQGQPVNLIKLNGKSYVGLNLSLAVMKLGANMIDNIEIIDDYGRAAMLSSIKDSGPDKLLNINIKKDRSNDLEQILLAMNVNPNGTSEKMTIIHLDCRDFAMGDVWAAINSLPAGPEPTVDDYGDQIPHFVYKSIALTWNYKSFNRQIQ